MKKLGKIIGIIAGILILLCVGLVVLAKVVITPERVRDAVVPLAQKALQREVQIGDIEVSLFKGITLSGLVVREKEDVEPFVEAGQLVLRYQLMPLLKRRVVVDEIRLESPRIRIARLPDGRFNFSDLTAGAKGEEVPVKTAAAPSLDGGPPVDLLVSKVVISGGELVFLDFMQNPATPHRLKLSGLDVQADQIALDKNFPYSLKARINDAQVDIQGDAHVGKGTGQALIKLEKLDLSAFTPYFKEALPGNLGSAKLSLDIEAEGGADAVHSKGKVTLDQLDLVLNALKDAPFKGARASLDYVLDADLKGAVLKLGETRLQFSGIPLQVSGTVTGFKTDPVLNLKLRVSDLDLRAALAAVPKAMVKSVDGLDAAGRIDLQATLAGRSAEPMNLLKDGLLQLTSVQAGAGGFRPAFTGSLRILGDTLTTDDMKIKIGENEASMQAKVSGIFDKNIQVSSHLTSQKLLLDPILGTGPQGGASATPSSSSAAKTSEELGPINLPLKAQGTVAITETLYKGLAIRDFQMNYRLENNVLTIDPMTGKVAEGTFKEIARIDLGKKGLAYNSTLTLEGVQAEPLVAAFAPKAKGTVFGALNLQSRLDGTGTTSEAIKRNLSGKGEMLLNNGRFTGSGIVAGLASFLAVEELKDLKFNEARGSYTIDQGRVNLKSSFKGEQVRMTPQGSVGLDGSLDVALDARLSPQLTAKIDRGGKVAKFFTDDQGWGQFPLAIAGSFDSPKVSLDASAAQQKAVEQVKGKLQEKLLEKLGPKTGTDPAKSDPAKDLLQQGLKGLFGN